MRLTAHEKAVRRYLMNREYKRRANNKRLRFERWCVYRILP